MVVRVDFDSLRKMFDGFFVALGFECFVSFILELEGLLIAHK